MKKEIGIFFILLSLLCLLGGLFFGTICSFQFVATDFFKLIPFFKSRPIHVSLVVSWIFLSAMGGIYYYLPKYCGLPLFSRKMAIAHLWLFVSTGILILISYLLGKFGGREYWEFPTFFAFPIIATWLLFGINYFKTILKNTGEWPVYLWMWATGVCFFLFTFIENNLWIIPYFRNDLIRDITIQWKAAGALVGSWNMLVYGTAIFVMEKIKGDGSIAKSKIAFLMYFLGFTNLLFGWAHHIYSVPTAPWIRYLSYLISMTELIIFFKIIWQWKNSLTEAKKDFYFIPYKFLVASEFWIFLNLTLAILISIPAINVFTHGTHITVAHAMGSSIGINTMILLASILFIICDPLKIQLTRLQKKSMSMGFWITQVSLLVFWLCLIFAGAIKGIAVIENTLTFQEIMGNINSYLITFAFSGVILFIGLLLVIVPAIYQIILHLRMPNT